jgi:hypothetical protein
MLSGVVREAHDLIMTVLGRDGDENRFVKAAADYFHLAAGDKFAESLEIFRMSAFHPLKQGAGVVQA